MTHVGVLSGGEVALVNLVDALQDTDSVVLPGQDGDLVERLTALGHRVDVVAMDEGLRDVRRSRATIWSSPAAAWRTMTYTVKLARKIRSLDVDIVQTVSLKAAFYGGLAGRLARKPVVWSIQDRIAPDYLPKGAIRLVHLASRVLPTAVVANSRATASTLGPWASKAPVIYPPVPCPEAPASGPPDGPFTVIMVGRLAHWKGQHVAIEAFARAFAAGPERLILMGSAMFGEHDYAASLDRLTETLGITAQVEFAGFRPDVGAQLARAHVLVHASILPEPFGQVVVEGMHSGLAVIASNAGGPSEVLTDGHDGLLAQPGDADDLARCLRRLRDDPQLRTQLAEAGRQRAKDFSPAVIAAEFRAVFDKVIAGRIK